MATFLGVMVDENFNWKSHVNYTKVKISKTIAVKYKVKGLLDNNAL